MKIGDKVEILYSKEYEDIGKIGIISEIHSDKVVLVNYDGSNHIHFISTVKLITKRRPIRKGDVISIKGKDCELKSVIVELTDEKYVKVQLFNMQCDLYVERAILIKDNKMYQ